ncbi:hypothetical protein SDC9_40419 [bioreactor metagenome]|uniref:Uncharacterized protein n=1 Tax=bioreactor metagenome TaxID=1076179 RepID=A0A644VS93_9ZZZZ
MILIPIKNHLFSPPASLFCIRQLYRFGRVIVGVYTGRYLFRRCFRHALPFLAFTGRIKLRRAGTAHLVVVIESCVELLRRVGINISVLLLYRCNLLAALPAVLHHAVTVERHGSEGQKPTSTVATAQDGIVLRAHIFVFQKDKTTNVISAIKQESRQLRAFYLADKLGCDLSAVCCKKTLIIF